MAEKSDSPVDTKTTEIQVTGTSLRPKKIYVPPKLTVLFTDDTLSGGTSQVNENTNGYLTLVS